MTVAMAMLLKYFCLKHSLNQCMAVQIYRICLTQKNLELINFSGVSGNGCCHDNAFKTFWSEA